MTRACKANLYQYRRWPRGNRFLNRFETVVRVAVETVKHGSRPYIVPWGGTSSVGAIGYVNAAFELKDQIDAGEMPEPDLLYVAMGTMGTAAGLMLGLKATGLKTRLVAVPAVGARPVWRRLRGCGVGRRTGPAGRHVP